MLLVVLFEGTMSLFQEKELCNQYRTREVSHSLPFTEQTLDNKAGTLLFYLSRVLKETNVCFLKGILKGQLDYIQ